MTVMLGAIPALGRWAERIPPSIGSAMLAGVLLPFCLGLFRIGATDPLLVALALAVFLVARQRAPRYAILLVLATGSALALLRGDVSQLAPGSAFGKLVPTAPVFDARAVIGLGGPLFLVTLVSQNLPGMVVLRVAGYQPRSRPLLVGTGVASLVAAPFGAHGVCLAAITAAICTNEEAHPDRARRWIVGVIYAALYLLLALFAPALVRLFLALPKTLIAALTGVALVPALLGALENMFAAKDQREAALVTFLAAGSGLALFGLGSAFWGLVAGGVAWGAKALMATRTPSDSKPRSVIEASVCNFPFKK
jgi:benzoate membrane transport protein